MICKNCNNEVDASSKHCPFCGADLEVAEAQAAAKEAAIENIKNSEITKKIPLAAVAGVIVIIAIVFLLTHIGGSGVKSATKDYLKYLKKSNSGKLMKMWLPKDVLEDYLDDEYDEDYKDYKDDLKDGLKEGWKEMKDAKGKISFKYADSENLDKLDDLKKKSNFEDLDEFKDALERKYDDYGFDASKVKKAYIVEVEVEIKADGAKHSGSGYLYVYKYKGKWYVYNEPADNLANLMMAGIGLGGLFNGSGLDFDDLDFGY